MTDETVYRTMLFDFYGELLTEKQRTYLWLLDNWYLAVREGQDACDAFRHSKRLHTAGKDTRIFTLATTLLRAGGGEVTVFLGIVLLGKLRDLPAVSVPGDLRHVGVHPRRVAA